MKTKKDSWFDNVYKMNSLPPAELNICSDLQNGSVWYEDEYGNKFEHIEDYNKYKRNKNIDFFLDNQ